MRIICVAAEAVLSKAAAAVRKVGKSGWPYHSRSAAVRTVTDPILRTGGLQE